MKILKEEIKKCRICEEYLPLGCNPIFVADEKSKIALISQAPGKKVHESSIPWNDKSGDNLRSWLSVSKEEFYDAKLFAIGIKDTANPQRLPMPSTTKRHR